MIFDMNENKNLLKEIDWVIDEMFLNILIFYDKFLFFLILKNI